MFESGTQPKIDMPSFGSRYSMERKLAAGGMGAVYKAYDLVMDRPVAIKVLHPSISSEVIVRFQKEAKATAKLEHPNILKVLDFGQTPGGDLYLVMDFINGFSLEEYIKEKGALAFNEAIPIFNQILSGLQHAHEKRILHRDLKPSNVMLSEDESGKLHAFIVDFGLAKLESDEQKLTTTGLRIGSPLYMSPEQGQGIETDHRADIYGIGCLIYKTLTGSPPFRGESYMETIEAHIKDKSPTLSEKTDVEYNEEIEALVAKCLAKDPANRYQSVEELRMDLLQANQSYFLNDIEQREEESVPVSIGLKENTKNDSKNPVIKYWFISVPIFVSLIVVSSLVYKVVQRNAENDASKITERPVKPLKKSDKLTGSYGETHELLKNAMDKSFSEFQSNKEPTSDEDSGKSSKKWMGFYSGSMEDFVEKRWQDKFEQSKELREFLPEDERKEVFSKERIKEYCRTPSYQRLLNNSRIFSLLCQLHPLFSAPDLAEIWKDPTVEEFLCHPKEWSQLGQKAKYKNNKNIRKLLRNSHYKFIAKKPKFGSLFQGSAFQRFRRDPLNWKLVKAIEISKQLDRDFVTKDNLLFDTNHSKLD